MRRAALAAALAVAAAGCGGGDSPPDGTPAQGTKPPPSDADRIRVLLDDRAAALEDGDAAAYAAAATGRQRDRDRRAARNARGLPLRDVAFDAGEVEVDGRRARLKVAAAYGVRGVGGEFRSPRRMTARKTQRGWRIAKVSGGRGRPPWEVARFRAERTPHFMVLAPADLEAAGLTDALEEGYSRIRRVLTRGRLKRRYLAVVAGDPSQAIALTRDIAGVGDLAAISDSAVRETGPARRVARVLSQRLLVVWPPFSSLDPDSRARVVTHELTHAVLAASTSGRTPGWLVEGIALYVSGDRRPAPGAPLRLLSEPTSIAQRSGEAQGTAYALASAASFAIADRYGPDGLLDLYDAFNDEDLRGNPGPKLVDKALRRTLHVSLSELEASL